MTAITASRKTGRARGYIAKYQPQQKTTELIEAAIAVLEEYRKHWPLTVRQIFYRLVGAHGFDKSEAFYSKLCHHLANARRARVVPFHAIRDDGISTVSFRHFNDQDDFRRYVREQAEGYRRNLLADQPRHIEVWCEAAGMILQLAEVAERFSVAVFSSSGFDSLTAKKALADRICRTGKPAVILHLGDFDPSGASMFDVIAEDVAAFVAADRLVASITVRFERVTLTEQQVAAYDLPTAPAKATDSRTKAWGSGETCQLEALAPDQIAQLLEAALYKEFDLAKAADAQQAEAAERRLLTLLLPAPEEQS